MNLPTDLSEGTAPVCVSVMIRTMGRATLTHAINSVVGQSFRNWEILVVNASAQALPSPLDHCIAERITWIEPIKPLGRSEAANALLDAAQGRYAIFLDDDDWLLPDHLSKLVCTLESDPALVAAYGDVQSITGMREQPVDGHVFSRDFDLTRLQIENYLPIHAVLFCRHVAEQKPACRFDTQLQLFEDWDFWLQLAVRGPFHRVPGVSAIYALSSEEGSGHAQVSNEHRQHQLRQLAVKQLARWSPVQVTDLMQMLAQQTQEINHGQQVEAALQIQITKQHQETGSLQQRNAELTEKLVQQQLKTDQKQQVADSLQEQLTQQQRELSNLEQLRVQHLQQLLQLDAQLAQLYQSRSWRFTKPLRGASRIATKLRAVQWQRLAVNGTQAVQAEIRRHGWPGFVRRLPSYLRHGRVYLPRILARPATGPAADFHEPAPPPRDVRLHPELSGGGEMLDFKVSVVIPTLNAGAEFSWLLRKLRAQKSVREIEIVVVDSGSRDDTVARAQEAGCTLVQILPSEFSHSYSRNRGADAASGNYVLFMVQDAYPIGDYWMYGMLRYLLDHADQNLVAASCAEYCRSDSDMMYDSMVNTHYRFLGCLEYDRMGEYQGADHMALRSQGQLSDVSCMISRELFMEYRYQGDYAEDLDLGIRLIKDGYRVAMLASVKVIHSHNRPAYYYLKRSFVDVIFLVELFDDFLYPRCESATGLLAGIVSAAAHVTVWLEALDRSTVQRPLGDEIDTWLQSARQGMGQIQLTAPVCLGDERLDNFMGEISRKYLTMGVEELNGHDRDEARRFSDSFLARLDHFNHFAAAVYGPQDSLLRHELRDVVRKTLGAAAGAALGFFYLDRRQHTGHEHDMAAAIYLELKAGI